jgi:hypothetical protein
VKNFSIWGSMSNAFRAASLRAFSIRIEYSSRGARDGYRHAHLTTAVGHHRQHGELRLAQCLVGIGHLGDARGSDDAWYEDPVADIEPRAPGHIEASIFGDSQACGASILLMYRSSLFVHRRAFSARTSNLLDRRCYGRRG